MIVDLVSPWLAALEAPDPVRACASFRDRHAPLLDALRRIRAPLSDALPLSGNAATLRPLARRAADPAVQQQIREALARAADLGADRCRRVLLVAGDGTGDGAEPIPWPHPDAVLFLDRIDDDGRMIVALARAVAVLTRWTTPDAHTHIAASSSGHWDRWEAVRDVPLREWIYAEGVGLHLAHALQPHWPPHQLLGVTQVAFGRLRQRERTFSALLDADLDQRGIGMTLRWLTPSAPMGLRTIGDIVLPPMAGCYLAWRMLSERVARAGLRETITMEA
jgi:hypothetical protein